MKFEIHPSIGVARVGNSPREFYLAPETLGGLPLACDAAGNVVRNGAEPTLIDTFKDSAGRIKRQAARFTVMVSDGKKAGGSLREAVLGKDITRIEWCVHLANKKAAWYEFSELQGDLMLGATNSYAAQKVKLRNAHVHGAARQALIIDPGPRTVAGPNARAEFTPESIPRSYRCGSFPKHPTQGDPVATLGTLLTDRDGRLIVLGGHGNAGGNTTISSFSGADSWHDDISDGPVTCRVTLKDGSQQELHAWVIVGSPKFAPEIVNIVTLDDVMFDVGVRFQRLAPKMFDARAYAKTGGWNPAYRANFERDIQPIIERPAGYQWVANVPSMTAFSAPRFDPRDNTKATAAHRAAYFSYFRRPGPNETSSLGEQDALLGAAGIPMMPLNSGSNSVTGTLPDLFLTLTETQYFLLGQWAKGKFSVGKDELGLEPLDRASVGNCVGSPMCPGIEVTWNVKNPAIYAAPYQVLHRDADYAKRGLTWDRDECAGGGCEPGDLTKRMSSPWQSDFFLCVVQIVSFSTKRGAAPRDIEAPPSYYLYWWPPQSPVNVMSGMMTAAEQAVAGVPSGYPVAYQRGINSFGDMLTSWSYLGFVRNRNAAPGGGDYPDFEEVERNHGKFVAASAAIGDVGNWADTTDTTFQPVWYVVPQPADTPRRIGRHSLRRRHHHRGS
jgi:L-lysine 6-oxidase